MMSVGFDGSDTCSREKTPRLSPVHLAVLLTICSAVAIAQDSAPPQGPPPGTRTGFTINVQVITKSEFAGSGVGLQHQRSYNDEHGIDIPVTINPDGSFAGSNSGSDSGTADMTARGINGDSKFGNTLSIFASGTITPGDCSAIPCTPSTMHLTLSGITSQQNAIAHVRAGSMNRTYGQETPGGSGTVIMDLPAVVGGKAEQVLFSNTITTSIMIVTVTAETVVPPTDPEHPPQPHRPPGLPLGPPDGGDEAGSSHGAGSGPNGSGGGRNGGPGAGSDSGAVGIVIPGLENGIPAKAQLPTVMIAVKETIHTSDKPVMPVSINVADKVHVKDTATVLPPVMLNVSDNIHLRDTVSVTPKVILTAPVHK